MLVSAHWSVTSKQPKDVYTAWFQRTMKLDIPMVFFTDDPEIQHMVAECRQEYITHFVTCSLGDLPTWSYRPYMVPHPIHSPSIDLLSIWHAKIFLIQRAATMFPDVDWFVWYDAGMSLFRYQAPSSEWITQRLDWGALPSDRMVYTSTQLPDTPWEPKLLGRAYYHVVSGTYAVPRSQIDWLCSTYRQHLDSIFSPQNKNSMRWMFTDQAIWTAILFGSPERFHCGGHGYGVIMNVLCPVPTPVREWFQDVYYINLTHRNDRREHVQQELARIGVCSPRRWNATYRPDHPALGCSVSHLACLIHAANMPSTSEFVTIVEDDIVFTEPDVWIKYATQAARELPATWDVVLIAGNNAPPFQTISPHLLRITNCYTTTGYIVRRSYLPTLIQNVQQGIEGLSKRKPDNQYAIDVYWKKLQQRDEWYFIVPPTVIQKVDYSDIERRVVDYRALMTKPF